MQPQDNEYAFRLDMIILCIHCSFITMWFVHVTFISTKQATIWVSEILQLNFAVSMIPETKFGISAIQHVSQLDS